LFIQITYRSRRGAAVPGLELRLVAVGEQSCPLAVYQVEQVLTGAGGHALGGRRTGSDGRGDIGARVQVEVEEVGRAVTACVALAVVRQQDGHGVASC
jgi:hypothetical protein